MNLLFEYFLFFKWIFFKNRPRGNLLFLRALFMVSAFAAMFFGFFYDFGLVLAGIEIDPVIAFAGAVVIGYWNMTGSFHKKSSSCALLYTEMLKAGGSGRSQEAKLLSVSLALELITLDLWAHRKYRHVFAKNLYRAAEHAFSQNSVKLEGLATPDHLDAFVEYVNHGKLQAKEARILLDNYQDYLMFVSNKSFNDNAA